MSKGTRAPATEPPESWAGYDIGDASLRRRLGDLTKKYESLEMRHRDLREVGVKEAERNFERLKKQAEERTAAANQLIAELKAELAAQAALAKDGEQLRKQLEASEAKAENLEGTIEDLNDSLSTAKTEIKTIYSKLAAVRSREDSSESIIEGNGVPNRTAQAAAQAKEDLYADLTGLIIRSVKQEETEDIFDCIQTGCNGTLHFKLTVANGEKSDRYEDMVFSYQPRFVDGHDRDLQDMLPNFLVLDIDFERSNVPKFYKRLFDSMTKDSRTKQINEAGSNAE
ncbi:hypothetical protein NM208_g8395 [Fusarium decemcellulare]|uniref:Uncharacterized protein n=1 Tax=Fusarium decemcellulare TaxID=57161 RepID=A0ACC1S5S9_9HYPO|nr:hypothetical protein NM208_g8395 [Fusarium decemcellulare]